MRGISGRGATPPDWCARQPTTFLPFVRSSSLVGASPSHCTMDARSAAKEGHEEEKEEEVMEESNGNAVRTDDVGGCKSDVIDGDGAKKPEEVGSVGSPVHSVSFPPLSTQTAASCVIAY